jgi:hypothetical protein
MKDFAVMYGYIPHNTAEWPTHPVTHHVTHHPLDTLDNVMHGDRFILFGSFCSRLFLDPIPHACFGSLL